MGSDVNGPEPTGWELMRVMNDFRKDVLDRFDKMAERQDRNVSKELFEAHKEAVSKQFAEHSQQLSDLRDDHEVAQHAQSYRRRWVIGLIATVVISPAFAAWITWLLTSK